MTDEPEIHVWELPEGKVFDLESAAYPLDVETVLPGARPRLEMANRGKKPHVRIEEKKGVVRVRVEWDGDDSLFGWFRWGRPSRVTVHLPAGASGKIALGAGNVRIGALDAGQLRIETGAGNIQAARIAGRIALHTAAGSIQVSEIDGGIDAATSAGSVRVRVRRLDPGRHRIFSDAGSVRVDVAEGIWLRVVPDVAFGHAKIDVAQTTSAPAILEVGSAAGSVAVRPWPGEKTSLPSAGPYRSPPPEAAQPASQVGDLERILEMVAAGTLTPDQAGELIGALETDS